WDSLSDEGNPVLSNPPVRDPLQAVNGPAGPAPRRRAKSIRRTSSIDGSWPGGFGTQLRLDGRARDAITHSPVDAPVVVAESTTSVGIGDDRTIEDLTASPDTEGLGNLVGCRGGGYLRAALAEFVPHELDGGTPLYLLLDDISGASLVAGIAWSQWTDQWARADPDRPRPDMEGVCIGFAPGGSALEEQRSGIRAHRVQIVPRLVADDDPHGWHELPALPDVSFRRARRIDVWRDPIDGTIMIDSGFQDSAGTPRNDRVAVHEYVLRATVDPATMLVTSVDADPRILPFLTCPNAVDTAPAVIGTPVAELRTTVLERLAKTNGCTHLNDALRALAEVPVLLAQLDAEIDAPVAAT
ncbi:MAG: DUF2889 domain-containing protein, partial [Ilumatobacteraceae bacterium]